jgi:hypothetical protein
LGLTIAHNSVGNRGAVRNGFHSAYPAIANGCLTRFVRSRTICSRGASRGRTSAARPGTVGASKWDDNGREESNNGKPFHAITFVQENPVAKSMPKQPLSTTSAYATIPSTRY